jgi:type IV pilus assembly protein PilY1
VDAPVRVFDAKILADGTYYSDTGSNADYGTFMVFGLNMGGKRISVNEDFGGGTAEERTFYPTYVMMDVTEPRNPKLMWERTYPELGMTTCIPAPLHIGPRDGTGEWYLVFGSGPTEYDATSNLNGHVFVVDMKTGDPVQVGGNDWIATSGHDSYFTEPLVLDLFQSHNPDAVYLANNYVSGNAWQSDIWKIAVPCSKCEWDVDGDGNKLYTLDEVEYSAVPADWQVAKTFFEADGPITAQMNSTVDVDDNLLLYVGTGRYLSEDDKEDAGQQYLYCIKDPFYFNKEGSTDYHNFGTVSSTSLDKSDLLDSDSIKVAVNSTGEYVLNYTSGAMDFWDFVEDVRKTENGWYLSLLTPSSAPSERIITQTSILGGIQITPTFTPSADICGMGGDTTFIGTYYETGTGYISQLFNIGTPETESVEGKEAEVIAIRDDDFYKGMPAPKAVFHAGLEQGARITTQTGTGEFVNFSVDPALYFKSMATEWWDDPTQAPAFNDECGW